MIFHMICTNHVISYIKQELTAGRKDKSTNTRGYLNPLLSETTRTGKQKISRDIQDLNNPVNKRSSKEILTALRPNGEYGMIFNVHKNQPHSRLKPQSISRN